jgi:hypothetical protein
LDKYPSLYNFGRKTGNLFERYGLGAAEAVKLRVLTLVCAIPTHYR